MQKDKKLEYLLWEKKHYYLFDRVCIKENRRKLGITEEEVKDFYGDDYIDVKPKRTRINKKNSIEKFSMADIRKQVELFKELFNTDDEAYLRIRSNSTGEYYTYNINSLMVEEKLYNILNSTRFSNNEDLMYSLNLYNNMKNASAESLFSLHTLAIDVDFDEVSRFNEKKPMEIIKILEKNDFNKTIPKPNIIEYGNRLRLIYNLEKVYSSNASKSLARRIAEAIGERLVDYGAKAQPLTSYGRIVGSINTRGNQTIEVMYLDVAEYKLKDLKEKWLGPLPEWYAEWKSKTNRKKAKVISFNDDFQKHAKARKYNLNRIDDFFKIQEFYNYHCDGRRFMCFMVRNHCKLSGMSNEEAMEVLRDFNNRFRYPLRWNIIEQDTRNVERKQYYYPSKKILAHIGIEPAEEEVMNLKAILSETEIKRRDNEANKIRQKAKYRDEEGLTKTELKRRNEFILIARMELDGMNLSEIAIALNKDRKTIREKMNKVYENINYQEIKCEVKNGVYQEMAI